MIPKKIDFFDCSALGISNADYLALIDLADQHEDNVWSTTYVRANLNKKDQQNINEFKKKLKDHLYYISQGRYCCYCGSELTAHHGTFDIDHIISKIRKKNLIFDLRNLALTCKPCNSTKSKKKVTVVSLDEESDIFFSNSSDYIIVHPHLDNWSDFLYIDDYGRTLDYKSQEKGNATLLVCGINKKNAMALADHFDILKPDIESYRRWVDFYFILANSDNPAKKIKYKKFLRHLLLLDSDPAGKSLLAILEPLL